MAKEKINNVVGDSFEDLKIDEMAQTQGAGDVDAETTPVVVSVATAIASGLASYEGTVKVTKTVNGHC